MNYINQKSINDVYIIDDIVPKLHQEYLEKLYISPATDWRFQKDITYHKDNPEFDNIDKFNYGFSNLIFDISGIDTPLYHSVAPIMYAALNAINLRPIRVLKARSFLQLPVTGQSNEINNPHRDADISHIVILYYLTDADGDTIIYNETTKSEHYTVMETVQAKRGRVVIFDGSHYHSSSKPTNAVRATININVLV